MKLKIGVSGNKGSFSEEAANYYCHKEGIKDYELSYLVGMENTLRDVNDGKVDLGIFPIENSNGGVVYEAVHAMSKYNFTIEKFFEIDVKHYLLVKPGVTANKISKIVSHPQALKQCRMYLQRKWEGIELEEYVDTASAAKALSEGELPEDCAVIAPKICAELYDLEILEEEIQDLKFNFTTFLAVTKQ